MIIRWLFDSNYLMIISWLFQKWLFVYLMIIWMINFFFPTKIAYFPTQCRFPHMCRFPHKMQISPVPYTIFPTRYVRIARSTFGMGGADLGAGAKVAAKLKCLLCHWADDLHRFSPFFRPPFQSHPLQTATARAGSRARSVTDAAVGCRALWVLETLTDAGPAAVQSRRTLEIVHNFGRARGHGPHLHVYKAFGATMYKAFAATRLQVMQLPEIAKFIQLASKMYS